MGELAAADRIANLYHPVGMHDVTFAAILIRDKAKISGGIGRPCSDPILGLDPPALGHPVAHFSAQKGGPHFPGAAAIGLDHFVGQR